MDEGISITAYAKKYGIDRKTVYRLIEDGTLTAVKVGNLVYLNAEEKPRGVKAYGDRPKYRK